jgi:hypothetical protein
MRQLLTFQGQCARKLFNILLEDLGRGWGERKSRDIDMWSAPCHRHSEIPHKWGRIIHQCQQILHFRLRSLLQLKSLHVILYYDVPTSDRNHIDRNDNAGEATLKLFLTLRTSSQNKNFVSSRVLKRVRIRKKRVLNGHPNKCRHMIEQVGCIWQFEISSLGYRCWQDVTTRVCRY